MYHRNLIFSIKPQIFELKCVFSYFRLKTHITLLLPVYVHSWEQRKVTEIGKIYIGLVTTMTKHYTDEGTLLIRNSDIKDGKFEFGDNPIYLEKTFAEKNETRMHQIGDVITVHTGDVGTSAVITENEAKSIGFATIVTRPNPKIIDSNYLCSFLNTDKHKKWAVSISTGDGRTNYNLGDYFELVVPVPSIAEQKKIASYIQKLNRLITLHQCKCQIDGCRFQSPLAITWEQRKFGEVFDCTVPNNTLSRAELSYDEGTVLNVHYGDVLIKYGSVLDVQKDDIPRIPHRCREDFNGALLQDGDVIIADTAEDETTGKACEIGNLQGSAIVSGLHTMVCRPRNRMALGYLGYYLNSNAYHYQLLPLMQGIKVLSLSRSNIQKTSVSYPSAMKEQQLIASYFSQLDHLITLHQRKYDKLTNVKKSMLEKMFPKNGSNVPEIRFKGFTEAWEQRKLGNVANYRRGSFPQPYGKSEWYDGDGAMPFVQVADVSDEMNLVENTKQKISMLAQPMSVFAGKNTVLVTLQGSIGRVAITQYGAFVDRTVLIFEKYKEKIDTTFWAYIVKQKFIDEARKAPGGTIKTITKEALSDFDLSIPNYKEQQQIGTFFKQLDNLITLHQRELEKLKNIKKSCLENMFV